MVLNAWNIWFRWTDSHPNSPSFSINYILSGHTTPSLSHLHFNLISYMCLNWMIHKSIFVQYSVKMLYFISMKNLIKPQLIHTLQSFAYPTLIFQHDPLKLQYCIQNSNSISNFLNLSKLISQLICSILIFLASLHQVFSTLTPHLLGHLKAFQFRLSENSFSGVSLRCLWCCIEWSIFSKCQALAHYFPVIECQIFWIDLNKSKSLIIWVNTQIFGVFCLSVMPDHLMKNIVSRSCSTL